MKEIFEINLFPLFCDRISAEALFLSLTASPSDLPLAEKLGVMLGLDLHKLYDIAADAQLSLGQFAQAVHLYQLSKCPQLKRVAHFMGYGFLSELIAYIQVLFSTKGVEIVSADKCHFANIALHCFAHQVKNKLLDRHVINIAFKKFLKENAYYDEEVAAKLFCEQGLNELLHYFAKIRGQQGLVVDTLLSTDGIKATIDKTVYDILCSSGYEVILHHSNDEYYMKCMTSCSLLQFLAAKPSLLNLHLQHLITLLPNMAVPMLHRVAILYNPSHHVARLFFRNLAVSKINKRYWSVSSLTALANEMHDITHKDEEISTIEDVIKFFHFCIVDALP
ncbi:x-linked retinitis pigmentosa GTPase regulator-like protein [Trichonephila clavipes]|nr:x-linked retinitis pigmentosa GTPase regulator-like protein [Trichonephila clavipes]